jgi:uncharacterized protein YkwD
MRVRKAKSLSPRSSGYRNKAMKKYSHKITGPLSRFAFLPHPRAIFEFMMLLVVAVGCADKVSAQSVPDIGSTASNSEITVGPSYSDMEHRVFNLINEERVKNGRASLVWADQVAEVARYHSSNMARLEFFSHEDPDGRRPSNRAEMLGLRNWRELGENIAWLRGYQDPAQRVVENWMRSPGHRENILESHYKESGIGVAVSVDGSYYITQVFVLRK